LAHDAKQVVVVQVKRQEVGDRIRALKDLAFATFMDGEGSLIPKMADASGRRLVHQRPDVFFHARENIRELGRKGGAEYEHAITALKFAYHDFYTYGRLNESFGKGTYRTAIQSILPPLKPAEHVDRVVAEADGEDLAEIHKDVESSDGNVRYEDTDEAYKQSIEAAEFVPVEVLKQAQ
jgi:hypothetical protein